LQLLQLITSLSCITIKTYCISQSEIFSEDFIRPSSLLEIMKENTDMMKKSNTTSLITKSLHAEIMNKQISFGLFLWEECNFKQNTIFSLKFHSIDFPMRFQLLRKNLPNLEKLYVMVLSFETQIDSRLAYLYF